LRNKNKNRKNWAGFGRFWKVLPAA